MIKKAIVVAFCALTTACTTTSSFIRSEAAMGGVPCREREIKFLSRVDSNVGLASSEQEFEIACRGKAYVCKRTSSSGWLTVCREVGDVPANARFLSEEEVNRL